MIVLSHKARFSNSLGKQQYFCPLVLPLNEGIRRLHLPWIIPESQRLQEEPGGY